MTNAGWLPPAILETTMSDLAHDLSALQAMDEGAWAGLQEDYYRRVYYYVKRYVNDHQAAEDLTQDVFLGAVRGIAGFDTAYTFEQFLFGIAKNRVIDHFRKHKGAKPASQVSGGEDASMDWLENLATDTAPQPTARAVRREDDERQRKVLAEILKQYVGELWSAGEFQKLMVLEYLFVVGGRNKDAASHFGIEDETAVAGIKYRAVERLRGMARQRDPNHSLFLGLWEPGAR